MFTILDYSSALEYSIIRRYTNIVYYYYYYRVHFTLMKFSKTQSFTHSRLHIVAKKYVMYIAINNNTQKRGSILLLYLYYGSR